MYLLPRLNGMCPKQILWGTVHGYIPAILLLTDSKIKMLKIVSDSFLIVKMHGCGKLCDLHVPDPTGMGD